MLSFGWQELILVAFILVLVVGPKDMPRVLRAMSNMAARMRVLANEFRSAMIDVANQDEVREAKQALDDALADSTADFSEVKGEVKNIGREAMADTGIDEVTGEVHSISQIMTQPTRQITSKPSGKPTPTPKPKLKSVPRPQPVAKRKKTA